MFCEIKVFSPNLKVAQHKSHLIFFEDKKVKLVTFAH